MWSRILRIVDRVGGTDKDVITRIIKARAPENWGWIKIQLPENSSKTSTFRAYIVRSVYSVPTA